MAHDIRATARVRLIRWRARKRVEAKAAKIAARDAKRAAKGLLPLAEANRAKQEACRTRQAALKAMIRTSWYAPALTDAEYQDYAKEHGWDDARARQRKESFEYATRVAGLNLNRFVLDNYCRKAEDQRLYFHEAVQSGMSIRDAVEFAKTAKFVPKGRTDIERELNFQERYEASKWAWFGREEEIVAAVLRKVIPST